jgi:hypothetical protein
MSERKQLFSNGSQYCDWTESNCDRCAKSSDWLQEHMTCDLQEEMADASSNDGTVTEKIYKRLGADSGNYVWMCPEVEWTKEWMDKVKRGEQ